MNDAAAVTEWLVGPVVGWLVGWDGPLMSGAGILYLIFYNTIYEFFLLVPFLPPLLLIYVFNNITR